MRLLLPDHLPEDRLIYLDSDTLIAADVSELYRIDLGSNPIAGVPDPGGPKFSRVPRHADDVYINSGVLVMDLARLRADGFLQACNDIHALYRNQIALVDQCVINKYAENRKLLLDPRWNRQTFANNLTLAESKALLSQSNADILHFVGFIKPWQQWCNPYVAQKWWSYASRLDGLPLKPTPVQTLDQAMLLTSVLDQIEQFQEASRIKGQLLDQLLKKK